MKTSILVPLAERLARCLPRLTLWLAVLGLAPWAAAQSFTLTNVFIEAPGNGAMKTSNTAPRGMAYDSVSNLVYISGSASPYVSAFDGGTGAYQGDFSTTGTSGGTFLIDQVGVAADGAIYAINLATSASSANKLYRWSNWRAVPTVAFAGNALTNGGVLSYTSGRLGDTLAVTGSGTGTLVLAGVGGKPYFSLFYTADGVTFTNTIIDVPAGYTTGGNIFGICFYTNNTFLVKSASSGGSTLYLVQFPANYAGQTVVTGVVLAATSLGASFNNTTMLAYAPAASLLAAAQTSAASSPTAAFAGGNLSAGAVLLAQTNLATTYLSGNASGSVAIGGPGGTNTIYEYTTGNSLYAYNLESAPAQPPSAAALTGGTYFVSDTLTVTPGGTPPFSYQWLASSSGGSAGPYVNLSGATTNSLLLDVPSTNYYEVEITNIAGGFTSAPVQVAILQPVTSPVVTTLWKVAPGAAGYPYLGTDNNTRGLGYDTNSQRLVVASVSGGTSLHLLDAGTGTNVGTLNVSVVSGGTFALDQVKVADDGVVYAGNLPSGSPGTGFTLYSWPAATNGATGAKVFQDAGSLGGVDRWGDTMAARGSGLNTEILLGSLGGTNVALLTTSDGVNFNGTFLAITNVPAGFAAQGIAFGAGNTLWAKASVGDLYEIAFDPVSQTGTVLLDYPHPSKIPTYQAGVAVDPVNNLMAGVDLGDQPNDLKLYQLTGTPDAPVLFDQAFFPALNGNGNGSVAIAMAFPHVFALDANNGLIGLTYAPPPVTAPTASVIPASLFTYTNNPSVVLSANVTGSLPIYYQWQSASAPGGAFADIGLATNSTLSFTNPPVTVSGEYQLVVHNLAGYATSAPPAQLTVALPVSSVTVTQLWTIPGGGVLGFLDGTTYQTRGLAYDTNTLQLVVADHYNLHLLAATNGNYLGDLNVAGIYTGGFNNWLFDQVGVADDGTLYAANLALSGANFSIVTWSPGFAVGSPAFGYAYGGGTGADPGNGSGDRWGDTLTVRGSGTGTEILIGSYSGTNAVLFTTTDGQNFTANLITVTNVSAAPGFAGQGIAFGAGDTFWAKSPGYDLRQIAFDRATTPWTGGVVLDLAAGSRIASGLGGIAVDVAANVLGGVSFDDLPNDFQIYQFSGNTNPPGLFNQAFFGSQNNNSQEDSVATLKGGKGFALDVNNGLTAISYSGTPGAPAVTIISVAHANGSTTILWNNTFNNHGYQVQSTTALNPAVWTNLGAPVVATGPDASYTDATASDAARYYRVISL